MAGLLLTLIVCLAIEGNLGTEPSIFYMYVDPTVPVECEGASVKLFDILEGYESLGSDETDYYFLTGAIPSKSQGPKRVSVEEKPSPSAPGDCVLESPMVGSIVENPGMYCQNLHYSEEQCECGGIVLFKTSGSIRINGVIRVVTIPSGVGNGTNETRYKTFPFQGTHSDYVGGPEIYCTQCPLTDVWVRMSSPTTTVDTGIVPYVIGLTDRPSPGNSGKKALCHVSVANMSSVVNAAKMYEDGFRITKTVRGDDGNDILSGIINAGTNLIGTLVHILAGGILANGRSHFPRVGGGDADRARRYFNLEHYITTEHDQVKVPATFKKAVPLVGKLIIGTNLQTDKSTVQEWAINDDPSSKVTPDVQGQIIDKPYGRAVLKLPVTPENSKDAEAVVVSNGKKYCFDADTHNIAISPLGVCGKSGVCEQHDFCNPTNLDFPSETILKSDTERIQDCIDDPACTGETLIDLMIEATEKTDNKYWADGRIEEDLSIAAISIGVVSLFTFIIAVLVILSKATGCYQQGTLCPSPA